MKKENDKYGKTIDELEQEYEDLDNQLKWGCAIIGLGLGVICIIVALLEVPLV